MTEPDRILAKPVRISASMRTARQLVGFSAALARLAGVAPGSLRSRAAIDAACAAVAEHDPAAGPVRVVAVRTGRRTVGHALAGDADVRLLAAAMLHRRSLLGVLDGALVPKLARKAGIRSAAPRRWASDPELDARARAAVDAVHRWFGVRFLAAVPGEAWSSALVVPRPFRTAEPDPEPYPDWDDVFGGAPFAPADDPWEPLPPGADLPVAGQRPAPAPEAGPVAFEEALGLPEPWPAVPQAPRAEAGPLPRPDAHEAAQAVVARPYPRPELIRRYRRRVDVIVVLATATTRSLLVLDLPGCEAAAGSEAAEEAALRARITAAVAAAATQPVPEKPSDPPQVETGFGENELGPAMFAVAGHTGLPRELGARLVAATPHQLARRARSAAALLRRSLPSDLHDVAGMLGDCFEGSAGACKFLRLHEGFTPEDNRRVAETLRLMPCLRPFHENRGMLDAIRSGARLDAVLRAALGRPVRPKTSRALRTGRFDPRPRARDATRRDLGLLVPGLDAYHAADPHLPALDPPQLAAAIEVARMLGPQFRGGGADEDALLGRAIAAHRDGTGRIRRPSPGELDLFHWIVERCRLGYGLLRQPQAYRHDPAPVRQAVAVLYPAHRRAEALVRLDVAWHRDVVRLAAEHDELVAALRAGARRRGRKDAAPPPPSYPHLIDAPAAVGGVTLTPLRGPEAIAAEGREMGHCIGTYAGRAASGYCMLLSLASDLGRSSAEIVACGPDERGGKAHLRVVQHQGPRNGPAPVGHPEALRDWIAAQPAGAVSAAAVIANTASRVMYAHRDPYHGIGDEGRARIAALAREQLAPYLHGTMKRQDPAAWRLM